MLKIFNTFCGPEPENRVQGTSCLTNKGNIKRKSLQLFNDEPSLHEMSKSSIQLLELSESQKNIDDKRIELNSPRDLHSDSDEQQLGGMELANLASISKKLLDTVQLEQIQMLESESRSVSNHDVHRGDRRASLTNLHNKMFKKRHLPKDGVNVENCRSKSLNSSQILKENSTSSAASSRGRMDSYFNSENSNVIGCYGKHVRKLKARIKAGDCNVNIFDDVLKQILNDLKLDVFPRFVQSKLFEMYLRCKTMENQSISLESFREMRTLGRGAFGVVNACRKRDTGKLYAMKQIDKKRVQATDAVQALISEKDFLSRMDSIFVTSLKYAFTTDTTLYLIMDLMTGGDLKFHLNQSGSFEENRCRFYAAQILLGLEHIHSRGIIYRDLKLENVLVDGRGHIKISDLGLAVLSEDNPRGYAGTPGYTAPEVVLTQYYDQKVDFFSFGVLIYRTLCGKKPFEKKRNKMKKEPPCSSVDLDRNVVEMFPRFDGGSFSPKTKNICRGLLAKNAHHRLGNEGFAEIKGHPWFSCIDWNMLESGLLVSPYTPPRNEINAEKQTFIGRPTKDEKYMKIKITKEFDESLKDFNFKSAKVIQSEIVTALRRIYDEREMFGENEDVDDVMKMYAFPEPYLPKAVVVTPKTKDNCLQCIIA